MIGRYQYIIFIPFLNIKLLSYQETSLINTGSLLHNRANLYSFVFQQLSLSKSTKLNVLACHSKGVKRLQHADKGKIKTCHHKCIHTSMRSIKSILFFVLTYHSSSEFYCNWYLGLHNPKLYLHYLQEWTWIITVHVYELVLYYLYKLVHTLQVMYYYITHTRNVLYY